MIKLTRSLCMIPVRSHIPALVDEVIYALNLSKNKTVLDLTFGYGGHSKAILESNKDICLFAFDRDPVAIAHAENLSKTYPQLKPIKGKFSQLEALCRENNIPERSVDFMLMDLGFSSMQMDDETRGFSLSKNGKLDMRMDQESNDITALDVVNNLEAEELSNIFKKYGEEYEGRKIANIIVEFRMTVGPIVTTHQLADLVKKFIRKKKQTDSLGRSAHPATKIFQALRIFINDELNELCCALTFAERYLTPLSGRCAVISFQPLEDELVAWTFSGKDFRGQDKVLQRAVSASRGGQGCDGEQRVCTWIQDGDPVTPLEAEVVANPRVRSAIMRVGRIVTGAT